MSNLFQIFARLSTTNDIKQNILQFTNPHKPDISDAAVLKTEAYGIYNIIIPYLYINRIFQGQLKKFILKLQNKIFLLNKNKLDMVV